MTKKDIKITKNKKFILLFMFSMFFLFILFNSNKVFAADMKLNAIPANPRVGDTFTVRATIVGNDVYSMNFANIEESSNLEYIKMDKKKTSSSDQPLTGYMSITLKVKEKGNSYVNVKVIAETAPVKNKKLDLTNIKEQPLYKELKIILTPEATNVTTMSGKFTVTDNSVNIRPHPSTTYSSIGSYDKGKEIAVTGKVGDWYQFTFDGGNGFMHKDYLKEVAEAKPTSEEKPDEVPANVEDEVETTQGEETKTEEKEEVKEPNVRDPRDKRDNTTSLIVLSIVIGIGIIIAIIYLIKQGKPEEEDDTPRYGMDAVEDEPEKKLKEVFKRKNNQ